MDSDMTYYTFGENGLPLLVKEADIIIPESAAYDRTAIDIVWARAKKEGEFLYFKRDAFTNIIAKYDYGKRTNFGWLIEMIVPESEGGTDSYDNLRAVHWKHRRLVDIHGII